MSGENAAEREELIGLVFRLMAADFSSEEEEDRALSEFEARVPHPRASDLIYYWHTEFDAAPTAEDIVDRALSYRPIQL